MSSLLDTNVVSQRPKALPDERVARWWQQRHPSELYVSAITFAEIRFGIDETEPGRRRRHLDHWLTHDLRRDFAGRTLPVTDEIAEEAGRLLSAGKRAGAMPELADALIAATARVHGLAVATLNSKHFERLGVELVKF